MAYLHGLGFVNSGSAQTYHGLTRPVPVEKQSLLRSLRSAPDHGIHTKAILRSARSGPSGEQLYEGGYKPFEDVADVYGSNDNQDTLETSAEAIIEK